MKYLLIVLMFFTASAQADLAADLIKGYDFTALPFNKTPVDISPPNYSKFNIYTLSKKEVAALTKSLGKHLKDPESIRYSAEKIRAIHQKGGIIAGCAEFNAKNSYGGYGNPAVVIFFMSKDGFGDTQTLIIEDYSLLKSMPTCIAQHKIWTEQF